jgi:hypothetical protein
MLDRGISNRVTGADRVRARGREDPEIFREEKMNNVNEIELFKNLSEWDFDPSNFWDLQNRER